MKNLLLVSSLFLLGACTPIVKNHPPKTIQINQIDNGNVNNSNYANMDKKHQMLLSKGKELLSKGERKKAIFECFNPIIRDYEKIYLNSNKRIYSARTQAEYDFYAMSAKNEGKVAHILSKTWSEAYYLKAYTLIDLKELNVAKQTISKALKLAPSNSKYLSEMGHIFNLVKDTKSAIRNYNLAEKYASFFSPENLKRKELLKAKRGIGFSYTELNKLDKAERIYREILAIDSGDKIAKRELKYIQELKKRR